MVVPVCGGRVVGPGFWHGNAVDIGGYGVSEKVGLVGENRAGGSPEEDSWVSPGVASELQLVGPLDPARFQLNWSG